MFEWSKEVLSLLTVIVFYIPSLRFYRQVEPYGYSKFKLWPSIVFISMYMDRVYDIGASSVIEVMFLWSNEVLSLLTVIVLYIPSLRFYRQVEPYGYSKFKLWPSIVFISVYMDRVYGIAAISVIEVMFLWSNEGLSLLTVIIFYIPSLRFYRQVEPYGYSKFKSWPSMVFISMYMDRVYDMGASGGIEVMFL
jgi:heme exporter protein D